MTTAHWCPLGTDDVLVRLGPIVIDPIPSVDLHPAAGPSARPMVLDDVVCRGRDHSRAEADQRGGADPVDR